MYLTHAPTEELNVTFNWYRALIKTEEEVVLCVSWTPTIACACRETITLEDGKRIKKDVPIVFKSVTVKVSKKFKNKICKLNKIV